MGTIKADLVKGVFVVNGKEESVQIVRNAMIRDQHVAAMNGDSMHLCEISEALDTMKWISAAHESMRTCSWVNT